jgi:hypothetical protein
MARRPAGGRAAACDARAFRRREQGGRTTVCSVGAAFVREQSRLLATAIRPGTPGVASPVGSGKWTRIGAALQPAGAGGSHHGRHLIGSWNGMAILLLRCNARDRKGEPSGFHFLS